MIIDTSFLIDLMRAEKAAIQKLEELKKRGVNATLTPVVAYEIFRGAEKYAKSNQEKEKIARVVKKLPAERRSFKWEDGVDSASIMNDLEEGEKIEIDDVMICSVARRTGEIVLTRNSIHFDRLDGVEVETY